MKRLIWIAGTLTLLGMIQTPVFAQDAPWRGSVELSYLQTSGNTQSQSLAAGAKVERTFASSKLTGEAKGLYGKKGDITSDKSWITYLKYDQNVTDRISILVLETVERNTLKGIEFRYIHQGGIGYYFIKTATDTLKGEAGAGYIQEDPVQPFKDRGFPSARVFAGYVHSFTEKSRFEQTLEYLPNLKETEDYIINEESVLITNLTGNFALKTSFAVTFDHQPPTGFGKSDRLFKTALLYTF